jgi:alpha-tubulin suppressor-like RCC1 family protein
MIKELECKKIVDVQCGSYHSLAVTSTGEIYSWGPGHSGKLG